MHCAILAALRPQTSCHILYGKWQLSDLIFVLHQKGLAFFQNNCYFDLYLVGKVLLRRTTVGSPIYVLEIIDFDQEKRMNLSVAFEWRVDSSEMCTSILGLIFSSFYRKKMKKSWYGWEIEIKL